MPNMEVDVVIEAAKKTGRVLRNNFGRQGVERVLGKGSSGDLTIVADKLAEDAAIETIKGVGNSEVLSEEIGTLRFGNPSYRWILDPLDGSTNYARGIPIFSVSIMVQRLPEKLPLFAVIFDPMGDRCFYAEKGKGASLNGKRIETSKGRSLVDSLFELDLHFARGDARLNTFTSRLQKLGREVKTFRRLGSCALALGYTAMGELDGFLDLSKNSRFLDVAAGTLILDEAGGMTTDMEGNRLGESYDSVIACGNPEINKAIRKLLSR